MRYLTNIEDRQKGTDRHGLYKTSEGSAEDRRKKCEKIWHILMWEQSICFWDSEKYTPVLRRRFWGANGVDEENIQKVMSELISPSGEMTGRKRPEFSPRLEYILEDSKVEAEQFHSEEIGTEHMLIALIRDIDCVATKILTTLESIFRRYIRKYLRLLALTRRLIRKNTDRKEEERTGYWISMVRI